MDRNHQHFIWKLWLIEFTANVRNCHIRYGLPEIFIWIRIRMSMPSTQLFGRYNAHKLYAVSPKEIDIKSTKELHPEGHIFIMSLFSFFAYCCMCKCVCVLVWLLKCSLNLPQITHAFAHLFRARISHNSNVGSIANGQNWDCAVYCSQTPAFACTWTWAHHVSLIESNDT